MGSMTGGIETRFALIVCQLTRPYRWLHYCQPLWENLANSAITPLMSILP